MSRIRSLQGLLFGTLPLSLALFFSGCAAIPPEPGAAPEPEPEPEPAAVEQAPQPTVARPPVEQGPVESEPRLFAPRVAIVLTDRTPAYENVALALGDLLQDEFVYDLADESLTPRETFQSISEIDAKIVVAIGLRAAIVAKSFSEVPVVFCQVFNVTNNDLLSSDIRGVSALPPLDLQVEAWKELHPNLKNVGIIVGEGHDNLIEEAVRIADSAGLKVHYRIARSDRETLYIFNRLTPSIDGFWLFPDNRILSPSVLRQMLNYASRHRVQVAVFNPALLQFGATFSSSSVESDIAETVLSVADRVLHGNATMVPAMTPLNEIIIDVNQATLSRIDFAAADTEASKNLEVDQ